MERMQVIAVLVLLFGYFVLKIQASDAIFYESFDDPFDGRWIVSEKDEYKGEWKHSKSEGHEDYGLLVSQRARKYAIVKELDKDLEVKGKKTILQFEVRLQNDLECGGAYIKFLRPQGSGWKAKEFDSQSPYSIMFGPDKCGNTNKVHFIFKHKNPKSGQYVEHHLKETPSVPNDKLTHVYTAIIRPDNRLRILVDGDERMKAYLLSHDDFDPPLIPPYTIPDPYDKKPEDWDERAKIPDPLAKKPDDWDEDLPKEIEDEEAVKPEGWLDDEPEEIDDPDATKPEDWDDEEDGVWEPPKVFNPTCAMAPGCGQWKRPTKRNPDYKGKWRPPLIDNPQFRGVWKPRYIPNPHYFEIEEPNFEPISAIGIEIWTMQDGILFDNIVIARDEKVADMFRESTWKPKYEAEKAKQKAEKAAASSKDFLSGLLRGVFSILYKIANMPSMEAYRPKIMDLIESGEEQPNMTLGILISILVVTLTVLFTALCGGKKPSASANIPERNRNRNKDKDKDKDAAADLTSNNQGSNREKEDETEKVAGAAPPHKRSGRRDA